MPAELEIELIAVMTAASCAVCGSLLLVRGMTMTADAVSHTILLGIVLAYFAAGGLDSPLLFLGAAAVGLVTVALGELLVKSRLVSEDSAVGVVFPLLFAIAVILITRYASSVHLDTDTVLLGELAFTPFERMTVFGADIGAKGIYTSAGLLALDLLFVVALFKELKTVSFDRTAALVMGFSPALLHYLMMALVSLTAVGSFDTVGSVLVVAFMAAPAATAYLLAESFGKMLAAAVTAAAASAIIGVRAALALDVSFAGAMATAAGLVFLAALVAAPKRGLVGAYLRRRAGKRPR